MRVNKYLLQVLGYIICTAVFMFTMNPLISIASAVIFWVWYFRLEDVAKQEDET